MSTDLVALAVLMAAVTWPSRALPMLMPGIERLPDRVHTYLRYVGPATLASLAAVNALVIVDPDGARVRLGVEALAVVVAIVVVASRRNLLLALLAAVVLVAVSRALGLAG